MSVLALMQEDCDGELTSQETALGARQMIEEDEISKPGFTT